MDKPTFAQLSDDEKKKVLNVISQSFNNPNTSQAEQDLMSGRFGARLFKGNAQADYGSGATVSKPSQSIASNTAASGSSNQNPDSSVSPAKYLRNTPQTYADTLKNNFSLMTPEELTKVQTYADYLKSRGM